MRWRAVPPRVRAVLLVLLIAAIAIEVRYEAVRKLPADFDELVYLPAAYSYKDLMTAGHWRAIPQFEENLEHPPLVKLLFATQLWCSGAPEPKWDDLEVGSPIPQPSQSSFFGTRAISAVGGVLQVLLMAIVSPLAGVLLALDTYHIKYSAQVYLEGIPGLMAVLAVFLFERAFKPQETAETPRRLRWSILVLAAASLGLAAAGKYLYAIAGPVLLVFLFLRSRSLRAALVFVLVAVAVFFVADPFLWPHPIGRLWQSLTFHWQFSHGEHVTSAGMPWYSPFVHLLHAAPVRWHPHVFYTGLFDVLILPLAAVGLPRAMRRRPVWVAWAGFGLLFLLLWPTKWPQYILLVLPPLTVCAASGIEQIAHWTRRLRSRGDQADDQDPSSQEVPTLLK